MPGIAGIIHMITVLNAVWFALPARHATQSVARAKNPAQAWASAGNGIEI